MGVIRTAAISPDAPSSFVDISSAGIWDRQSETRV